MIMFNVSMYYDVLYNHVPVIYFTIFPAYVSVYRCDLLSKMFGTKIQKQKHNKAYLYHIKIYRLHLFCF